MGHDEGIIEKDDGYPQILIQSSTAVSVVFQDRIKCSKLVKMC